ncbi:YALIA101S06e06502g1_1 [Yarrowia lipolytica]|nr:Hypothetical protein YALI2_D00722g [Yarrowia lipolytica]SEI35292.1 YALIA101S06e06502g1_1 [Yarrowia lipolytica]
MESSGGRQGANRHINQINAILTGTPANARRDSPSPSLHQQQQVPASVQIRAPNTRPSSLASLHERFSIAQRPVQSGSSRSGLQHTYGQRKRASPENERPPHNDIRNRPKVKGFVSNNKYLSAVSKRHKTNPEQPGVVEIGGDSKRIVARPYSTLKKTPSIGIPSDLTSSRLSHPLLKKFVKGSVSKPTIKELNDTTDDEDLFPNKTNPDIPEKRTSEHVPPSPQPASKHKPNDHSLSNLDTHSVSSSSDDDDRPMKTKQEKALEKDRKHMSEKKKKGKRRDYTLLKPAPLGDFLAQRPKEETKPPPASFQVLEVYLDGHTWNQEYTDLRMEAEGISTGGEDENRLVMDVTYYLKKAMKVSIKPCPIMTDKAITIHLDDIQPVKYNESFQVLIFEGLSAGNILSDGSFFETLAIKLDPLVLNEQVERFLNLLPCFHKTLDDKIAAEQLISLGGDRKLFEKRLEEVKAVLEKKKEDKEEDMEEDKADKKGDGLDVAFPLRRSTRLAATKTPSVAFPDFGDTHHYQTKSGKQMEITAKDVEQLRECEYLNDTLISLFLQIEHDKLPEEGDTKTAHRLYKEALQLATDKAGRMPEEIFYRPLTYSNTYVFSTYFVHKLLSLDTKRPAEKYQLMKKWTSKIDIFSKQCVIIPIVEHNHWYVMILWNLEAAHKWKGRKHEAVAPATSVKKELTGLDRSSSPRVTRSQTRAHDAGEEPEKLKEEQVEEITSTVKPETKAKKSYAPLKDDECIWMFALDSLNINHRTTAGLIFDYLHFEARERLKIEVPPNAFKNRDMPVPIQTNTWDCGVYLIHFVQMFFANPIKYLPHMAHFPHNKPRVKAEFRRMWSTTNQILDKREQLVKRVFQLKEGAANSGLRSKMLNPDMGDETPDDDSDDDVMITSSLNHSPTPKSEVKEAKQTEEEEKGKETLQEMMIVKMDKAEEEKAQKEKAQKEKAQKEKAQEEKAQEKAKKDVKYKAVAEDKAPEAVPGMHEDKEMDVEETKQVHPVEEDKMDVDVEEIKTSLDLDVEEAMGGVSTPDESIDVDSLDVEEIQPVHEAESSMVDVDPVDVDEFDFDDTPRKDSVKHGLLGNAFKNKWKQSDKSGKPQKDKDRTKSKTKWKHISIFERPQK